MFLQKYSFIQHVKPDDCESMKLTVAYVLILLYIYNYTYILHNINILLNVIQVCNMSGPNIEKRIGRDAISKLHWSSRRCYDKMIRCCRISLGCNICSTTLSTIFAKSSILGAQLGSEQASGTVYLQKLRNIEALWILQRGF